MSAFEWISEGGRLVIQIMLSILGWSLVAPFALLIPRRKDLIVVIGRNGGTFVDNAKSFFLQAQIYKKNGIQCTWVTEHCSVLCRLQAKDLPVIMYPSVKGFWFLLRTGVVVVDSFDWYLKFRHFLLCGSKKVQLWHGVGFKFIEDDKVKNEANEKSWISNKFISQVRLIMRNFTGRRVRYALVNTTSEFYLDKVFRTAFSSRYFSAFGYPRNSFNFEETFLLGADHKIMKNAMSWSEAGRDIFLIAPTFRESRASPLGLDEEACLILNDWCELNCAEIVFKFHPWDHAGGAIQGKHLHLYDSDADFYPLMGLASGLVTDYSSIYMDFLLKDKPVYFLISDLDDYVDLDRKIQFDYNKMTPGPKVSTWIDLLRAIEMQQVCDEFKSQRQELVNKAFDNLQQLNATPKLMKFMLEKGWLRGREH